MVPENLETRKGELVPSIYASLVSRIRLVAKGGVPDFKPLGETT